MSRGKKPNKHPQEAAAAEGIHDRQPDSRNSLRILGICILLAMVSLFVFRQTGSFDFVNYDDDSNVYQNPVVKEGLTTRGIVRAFTRSQIGHWVPLTTMSHMLDCQLHGMNPGGHHLTNVLLHTASAILLFLMLRKMTETLWPSAFVAAVFAIHPLRVESVAWVTERKDVLSGLFFMLTIGAYVRYAQGPRSLTRYVAVVLLFALGLMSKSMLVTLPFVLLLLDYWPLGRFGAPAARDSDSRSHGLKNRCAVLVRLTLEKLPLFALSAAASAATILADTHAIVSLQKLPLSPRIANALVSYVTYVWQMICPVGLAVFYPHQRSGLPVWEVVAAGTLLLAVTAGAVLLRHKQPWILVGWFWYLGMFVPVIGIVQSGDLARADRYTYLPHIGLYLLVTWTVINSRYFQRCRPWGIGVAAATIVAALAWCSRTQTGYWRDGESLWTRTLSCTSDNAVAHHNFGALLAAEGRVEEAFDQFHAALRIQPEYSDALNNLGNLLILSGRVSEAIEHFEQALKTRPDDARLRRNFGNAFLRAERAEEAIAQYRKALEKEPDSVEAHTNIGLALEKMSQPGEAITHYQRAMEIDPGAKTPCANLAWILATCSSASLRNGRKAIELAQHASQLSGGKDPVILDTLAAAYAETGDFSEAVKIGEQALELAITRDKRVLADGIRTRLKLYRAGAPFRDLNKTGTGTL